MPESSLNLKAVALHLLFDALGSAGAILAGVLVWRWGWLWADSASSVLIALFILRGAYRLLGECVDVLLESAPSHIDLSRIRLDLGQLPHVQSVHDLHVWSLSTGSGRLERAYSNDRKRPIPACGFKK